MGAAARFIGLPESTSPAGGALDANFAVAVPISRRDDEAAISRQWEAIRNAHCFQPGSRSTMSKAAIRPSEVLLFHLTGHYCPIYAWRERRTQSNVEGKPEVIREVLTNTSGQKPDEWLA